MVQMLSPLGTLRRGQHAVIAKVGCSKSDPSVIARLLEMGLLEGSWIEIVHEAPFWGDPIAIRVRGTLVALRRSEANRIQVWVSEECK